MSSDAPYFANHDRRKRLPWTLYHGELNQRIARAIRQQGHSPRVLVVGCGLEPEVADGPPGAVYYGCDLDARAIEECRRRYPSMAARLSVCPSPEELPEEGELAGEFDIVLAKEVIEHLDAPQSWARMLASRVAPGGQLLLSTPNYGRFSTLPWIEKTLLEWLARRDGYSRSHIHPSRFDRRRLVALDLPDLSLVQVKVARTGWTLLGQWRRD